MSPRPRPRSAPEALDWLATLQPTRMRFGLERMERALEALGHPERRFRAVHVAGTNGKGSTCAFLERCLREAGNRTGLYTSPHLVRVNERIRVDGQEISDAELGAELLEILDHLPADVPELTYFELGTLAAFAHFARRRVDYAVVETGLGGRLDATRTCEPVVTAISALSLDHTELLGDTLTAIAREKAGIFKPGVPAVTCAQAPEALAELRRAAASVPCPLAVEGEEFSYTPEGAGFTYRGKRILPGLALGLAGAHQRQNAALALACLEALPSGELEERAIREGLARTRWPGRLETVATAPEVILDGAHNPGGAQALASALDERYPRSRLQLVFAALADKDVEGILRPLLPKAAAVFVAPLASPRAASPTALLKLIARAAPPGSPVPARAFPNVAYALAAARQAAGSDGVVLCAGSLVLIGQVKQLV